MTLWSRKTWPRVWSLIDLATDKASAAFAKALALDPNDADTWYMLALTHRDGGNNEGYSQACERMVQQFANSDDLKDVNLTLSACITAPDLIGDRKSIHRVMDKALSMPGFPQRVLAAALARVAGPKEALEQYERYQARIKPCSTGSFGPCARSNWATPTRQKSFWKKAKNGSIIPLAKKRLPLPLKPPCLGT
jgi:tetratricopeptide (TPR) repeat protein